MKRENKCARALAGILIAVFTVILGGCAMQGEEMIKLRDLDFTVLSEEKIPEELKAQIDGTKTTPFQLTWQDKEFLYICAGYGQQETGGYSIAVNELYLTDSNICVNTSLLGPEPAEKANKTPSYPYIVIKTELLEQTVLFE